MSPVLILPARRRHIAPDGRFAVVRLRVDAPPRLLARFPDKAYADDYARGLRRLGVPVELRELGPESTGTSEAA